MKIEIKKLTNEEVAQMGVMSWPIWTKEKSTFDWYYDSREMCLILEGKIKVHTEDDTVEINPGDFVIFPQGLKCTWEIFEPVRKHYNFD